MLTIKKVDTATRFQKNMHLRGLESYVAMPSIMPTKNLWKYTSREVQKELTLGVGGEYDLPQIWDSTRRRNFLR